MKKNKGITLIALVITIIVLLILASVSIAMLTGENGLLNKATNAKETTALKDADEAMKLIATEWKMEKEVGTLTIDEFLTSKVPEQLDAYNKVNDNEYELEKDGYILIIDADGNIITETQKAGVRPQVSNIQITLEDGTEIADNSQIIGTKLKITFDTSIEGGQILEVTPSNSLENGNVTYVTNGTDTKVVFTIKGIVDGQEREKKLTISLENKYMIGKESLIAAIEEINTTSEKTIQVVGNGEAVAYNTNIIVYNGDLTFDGTDKGINNINLSNSTYSIGNSSTDVGTATSYAKNMVVLKVNGNLTINSGITVTACASENGYGGPKGMFIYCTGTLTNNGTIDMTARGAYAEGQNVYLYKNKDGSFEYVPAKGADISVGTGGSAVDGINGTGRQTGGGGSGSGAWRFDNSSGGNSVGGDGGSGTSYSGGAGRRRRIKLFGQL